MGLFPPRDEARKGLQESDFFLVGFPFIFWRHGSAFQLAEVKNGMLSDTSQVVGELDQ